MIPIPDEPEWSQMIQDETRWSQTKWSQMIPVRDDPRWSRMIPESHVITDEMISDDPRPRWSQITPDDPRWSKMILNALRQNDHRWLQAQMMPNDPYPLYLGPFAWIHDYPFGCLRDAPTLNAGEESPPPKNTLITYDFDMFMFGYESNFLTQLPTNWWIHHERTGYIFRSLVVL